MSFILKSNNRKNRSGSTLRAKVVTEVNGTIKSKVKDFPIIVREQKLSDKECVIRDKQQMESIIISSNETIEDSGETYIIVKDQIKELNTAITSATNGSIIDTPQWSITNENILSKNGEVINRPKFGDDSDFITIMSIKVHKGDEEETFKVGIKVPRYEVLEVLNQLDMVFGQTTLINAIKDQNVDLNSIRHNLKKPSEAALIEQMQVSNYINTNNINKVKLNINVPDIYVMYRNFSVQTNEYLDTYTKVKLLDSETYEVNNLSARDMIYVKNNMDTEMTDPDTDETFTNSTQVSYVQGRTGNQISEGLRNDFGITSNVGKSSTICYELSPKVKISSYWSILDEDSNEEIEGNHVEIELRFISNLVSIDDIFENLSKSITFGCLTNSNGTNLNEITNKNAVITANNAAESSRALYRYNTGSNFVICLKNTIAGAFGNNIVDHRKIDVMTSPVDVNSVLNLKDDILSNVSITLYAGASDNSIPVSMYVTDNENTAATNTETAGLPKVYSASLNNYIKDIGEDTYLYLPASESPSGGKIYGTLEITLKQSIFGGNKTAIIYFVLTHISA